MECRQASTEADRLAILRQRYDIFVEEYNFLLPNENGKRIESDEYDEYSLLFGVWEQESLIASCRLVLPGSPLGFPTLNTMSVEPGIIQDSFSTAEISRITIASDHRLFKKSINILQVMQEELCRFASDSGIQQLIGVVEPSFLRLLNCSSLPYHPFGPLQQHIGAKRYPVILSVQECSTSAQEYS